MSINEVKITYCPPYVQPEKRQYNKVADAFCALASTGSANPGIQYTQALLDAIDEERTSSFTIESLDRLSEAEMVLTAWQHRLRYRIHRNPIGPHLAPRTWFNPKDERPDTPAKTFIDDEVSLETTSMCFGVAERELEVVNCRYMNTPYVLTGQALEAALKERGNYHTPKERRRALAATVDVYERQVEKAEPREKMSFERKTRAEKAERKRKKAKRGILPIVAKKIRVSDDEFDAHYSIWYDDPSDSNQTMFFETLIHFVQQKLRTVSKNDKLRRRGQGEDVAVDFTLVMLDQLVEQWADGVRLDTPSHYVTNAWTYNKWNENKKISKNDRKNQQPGIGGEEDSDGNVEEFDGDGFCAAAYSEWLLGPILSETDEEYLARCSAQLSNLTVEQRVLAGMFLKGMKQHEIAKAQNVSQPYISKQMRGIKKLVGARR